MAKEHVINVDDEGRLQFIYDDELAFMSDLGTVSISRASHVEPGPDGFWYADMNPVVNGLVLGPFKLRSQALAAEVKVLREILRRN